MKDFDDYLTFHSIVEQLTIQRAKLSFFIHKNSYLDPFLKKGFQINDEIKAAEFEELKRILPPRKQWSRPNSHQKRSRFESTVDLNQVAIKNRIYEVHRLFIQGELRFLETPKWYQELRKFIFDLRVNINVAIPFDIKKPFIFPAKKDPSDPKNFDRRPLAKFFLRDRIVLSLTNKYLTKRFDGQFLKCSYAFRSGTSTGPSPTYHDAVKHLKEFRQANIDHDLFVSECDIKKFFDCVEHDKILHYYQEFKAKIGEDGVEIDERAERIFYAYLQSYCFNGDVVTKKDDQNYWAGLKDPHGKFPWVNEMEDKYKDLDTEKFRVGIPQGGALSGLIVNMLLHGADQIMMANKGWGENFIYLRYCDDMVISHRSPVICAQIFQTYQDKLRELNLIPHICADLKHAYCSHFWRDVKSRDVYLWSHKKHFEKPHSPWVSFVGYMISEKGELKVRKKSIDKQIDKHGRELIKVIKRLNQHTNLELTNREFSIVRSFETKLYTMSVGKINIQSYRAKNVEMCWGAGFRLMEHNKYTRQQLKRLDRSNKLTMLSLKRYFTKRQIEHVKEDNPKMIQLIRARYPHSFYSLLSRPK